MLLLLIFAFLGGVVTVLSPCILPILPLILSSAVGEGKQRPLGIVTGFILSFTFFTLFLTSIVQLFGIPASTLRNISVIVILLFGISLLTPKFQQLVEQMFAKFSRFIPQSTNKSGFAGGLLMGLSIGLLWTPCVGPILASVISLALTGSVTGSSALITFSYALGTAIPMLAIVYGGRTLLNRVSWLTKNTGTIQKVFGGVMIVTAVAIFFNIDRSFQQWVLQQFPKYGTGLTQLEDNELIQSELDQLQSSDQEDKSQLSLVDTLKGELSQPAPELIPGGKWFNLPDGEAELTIAELKGKVVLIDFWTYTCINCIRTLPYLQTWHEKYNDEGLVIIGIHTPEFEFEKDAGNVAAAIDDYGLTYAVVQDNNYDTWQAYNNRYWPAKYLIDKDGNIRYTHFGEGDYDETEAKIQELLKEAGATTVDEQIDNPQYKTYSRTPETYLGYDRISGFASQERINPDKLASYTLPAKLYKNEVAFGGNWLVSGEYAQPQAGAQLQINFEAKNVYLVMRSANGQPAQVEVLVDGQAQFAGENVVDGQVTVSADKLYHLVELPNPSNHVLQLNFADDNVEVFAFTFG